MNTQNQNVVYIPDYSVSEPAVKSRKRTSFEEFCIVNQIRPEVKAGFRVWLKGDYFHFDDEWAKLYTKYKNRKL